MYRDEIGAGVPPRKNRKYRKQHEKLTQRLKGRKLHPNWLDEAGIPHLNECDRK